MKSSVDAVLILSFQEFQGNFFGNLQAKNGCMLSKSWEAAFWRRFYCQFFSIKNFSSLWRWVSTELDNFTPDFDTTMLTGRSQDSWDNVASSNCFLNGHCYDTCLKGTNIQVMLRGCSVISSPHTMDKKRSAKQNQFRRDLCIFMKS